MFLGWLGVVCVPLDLTRQALFYVLVQPKKQESLIPLGCCFSSVGGVPKHKKTVCLLGCFDVAGAEFSSQGGFLANTSRFFE